MSTLAALTAPAAYGNNPLQPNAWETLASASGIAHFVLAVWASIAILGSRENFSLANTLALIVTAWFAPLIGPILVLITAYQRPRRIEETGEYPRPEETGIPAAQHR